VLLRALQDPRTSVRLASAWALADSQPGSGSGPVREALETARAALPGDGSALNDRQRHAFDAALAKLAGLPAPEIPRRAGASVPQLDSLPIVEDKQGHRFTWTGRSGY
jgi:hypothetical protein